MMTSRLSLAALHVLLSMASPAAECIGEACPTPETIGVSMLQTQVPSKKVDGAILHDDEYDMESDITVNRQPGEGDESGGRAATHEPYEEDALEHQDTEGEEDGVEDQRALLSYRLSGEHRASFDGPTRRRCPRSNVHCGKTKNRCRFMVFTGSVPKVPPECQKPEPDMSDDGACGAFDFACGGARFCGATNGELKRFAALAVKQGMFSKRGQESGRAKVECFRREGGYGKIPAWYKYGDFTNFHKCIDGDMLREMKVCEQEQKKPELGIRSEFAVRMNDCAKKHGVKRFEAFSAKCDVADELQKMEKCKEEVAKSFEPPPKREEGFKGEYVLITERGDCCRKNGAGVGNKKRVTRAKCEAFCNSVSTCKFFSWASKYKNCNLCSKCKISKRGNAVNYKSWALKEPEGTTPKPDTTRRRRRRAGPRRRSA